MMVHTLQHHRKTAQAAVGSRVDSNSTGNKEWYHLGMGDGYHPRWNLSATTHKTASCSNRHGEFFVFVFL